MLKGILVGKGNLTQVQEEFLRKALRKHFGSGQYELIQKLEVLNNARELQQGADFIVSLIAHPVVLSHTETYRKFNPEIVVYAFKTEQNGLYDSEEQARAEGCDIVYKKLVNGNETKWVGVRTVAILKNPRVKLEFEEEIPA